MWNARLCETKTEIKTAGRNINNLRYAEDGTLMAESEEKQMSLLMKVKEESEKAGLKLNIQKAKITASSPITSWHIDGENSKITMDGYCSHKIRRILLLGRKIMANLDSILKQRHHFAKKVLCSQSYDFSSSHIQMWELDHKQGWVLKNWFFWIVVLEKTLEGPLDCKKTQPVNLKRSQPWIFIESNDAEAETPILWPPDVKNQLNGQDPDNGKDWGWGKKGVTKNAMVEWHQWLNRHEFEQTLGNGETQGSLFGLQKFEYYLVTVKNQQQVVLMVKNLPVNSNVGDTGDAGLIPGSQRSPGGENGNTLQYSWYLENPMYPGSLHSMRLQRVK